MTPEQRHLIRQQLGRPPRGIAEISVQSADGIPMVLRMESLVDDKPFPTLFWLCSKDLHKAINQIETSGWVKQIEEELLVNDPLKARYRQNQLDYIQLRDRLMTPAHKQRIAELGFTEIFSQTGIGGIAQWDKVRCLHMQYAHYLCGTGDNRNVIGARMEEAFDLAALKIQI